MSNKKPKVLITGGAGDWAQSFSELYKEEFDFCLPTRGELDVSRLDDVTKFFDDNIFDVVINNAGTIHPKRILESDPELWVRDVNVNYIGTYYVTREALKRNPKTKIINISSAAGMASYPDWSSYCSSKAAVNTFTKSVAADGFEVFAVCPGGFDSKFRNYFNLDNSNLMSLDLVSSHVKSVIDGMYQSGTVLYFRNTELQIL